MTQYQYCPSDQQVPLHPGSTLADIMKEKRLTIRRVSRLTDIPQRKLTDLLKAKAAFDTQVAEALEKLLGIPASFWLARQAYYEMAMSMSQTGTSENKRLAR